MFKITRRSDRRGRRDGSAGGVDRQLALDWAALRCQCSASSMLVSCSTWQSRYPRGNSYRLDQLLPLLSKAILQEAPILARTERTARTPDTGPRAGLPGGLDSLFASLMDAVATLDEITARQVCDVCELAEAAISGAIGSLQRKGLGVDDPNRVTERTLFRSSAATGEPSWELMARAEEDFSARAAAMARRWRSLSTRARERAARLRVDRSPAGTEHERRLDVALVAHGEAHAVAEPLPKSRSGAPRVNDSLSHSPSNTADRSAASSTPRSRISLRSRSAWLWT